MFINKNMKFFPQLQPISPPQQKTQHSNNNLKQAPTKKIKIDMV